MKKQQEEELLALFDPDRKGKLGEVVGMEELRNLLSARISWLLDHEMERFFSIMYRIDVPEGKVREAIAGLKGNDVSWEIAGLVIERFQQKLAFREQYSQKATK